MPNYIAQVAFQGASGLSTDRYVNTFSFTGTGTKDSDGALIASRLDDFYNSLVGGGIALSQYMANSIISGLVKVYDRDDPEPREAAEFVMPALVARLGALDMPKEVALVLSIHGDAPITPRRRGRLFLGPFVADANVAPGIPAFNLINAARFACQRLIAFSTVDLRWTIYSPSSGLQTFVIGGWVDNAWDTMRSRGEDASVRYSIPI